MSSDFVVFEHWTFESSNVVTLKSDFSPPEFAMLYYCFCVFACGKLGLSVLRIILRYKLKVLSYLF